MIYSDTLPDQTDAALVRGISTAKHDFFVTVPQSAGNGDMLKWYHAARTPRTPFWKVREMIAIPRGDEFDIQQKTILSATCFFDALHACAQKEKTDRHLGKYPVDDPSVLEALDLHTALRWQSVAEECGQPLDVSGLPLPAAGGRILADGLFSSGALAIARQSPASQTIGNEASPAMIFNQLSVRDDASTPLDQLQISSRRTALYTKAIKAQNRVTNIFHEHGGHKRYSVYKNLAGDDAPPFAFRMIDYAAHAGLATAMAFFPVSGAAGFAVWHGARAAFNPAARLKIAFIRADLAVARLPAGPEKTRMQEFNRQARATYHLDRAAMAYQDYIQDKTRTRLLNRAIRYARKGLKMMGSSSEDTERIIARMYQGDFPDSYHFIWETRRRLGTNKDALRPLLTLGKES